MAVFFCQSNGYIFFYIMKTGDDDINSQIHKLFCHTVLCCFSYFSFLIVFFLVKSSYMESHVIDIMYDPEYVIEISDNLNFCDNCTGRGAVRWVFITSKSLVK